MTDTLTRVTDEFRRMDDELAAAVTLPAVDSVIRRTGTANRASTAAAAAVLTVGALGAITAVAQAGPPSNSLAALPSPGAAEQPSAPTSIDPTITDSTSAPEAAPVPGTGPRPRARVVVPEQPVVPAVEPTTRAAPTPDDDNPNDEGHPDKPTHKPTNPPKTTKPAPPTKTTDPAPTDDPTTPPETTTAAGNPGGGNSATPSA